MCVVIQVMNLFHLYLKRPDTKQNTKKSGNPWQKWISNLCVKNSTLLQNRKV